MKKIVYYEAFDGTRFDSETACEAYEYPIIHPGLFTIIFFDRDSKEYRINETDVFNAKPYNRAVKVIVHNEEELGELRSWAIDCGFCEFEQITEPGTWVRFEVGYFGEGLWFRVYDTEYHVIILDVDEDMDAGDLRERHIETAKNLRNAGFKITEVAKIMGKPESTIRRWLKKEER